MHLPGHGEGGGMSAMGDTPESVRVGDLRRLRRSAADLRGTKASISEFLKYGILYFTARRFFSLATSCLGCRASKRAAPLAASMLLLKLFFFGEKEGRLPLSSISLAAARALLALAAKSTPQAKKFESRPTMK